MSIKGEPKLPDGTGDLPAARVYGFNLIRTAEQSRALGISPFLVFHLPKDYDDLESWLRYWTEHCGEREGIDFFRSEGNRHVTIYRASFESRV